MTITRKIAVDSVPGYEIAYLADERNFEIEIDEWAYSGKWSRHSTEVNGVTERINQPCIHMRIVKDETLFDVMLVLNASGDGYRVHLSYKRASNGSRREHNSKQLDSLLEKFWQRYKSLDFQVTLHERAELEALDEMRQLKERIQLLDDYALNLKNQREELLT